MIRSSLFSFDESSFWDPKLIRQHLNIPEDQLNVLNSITEWSKVRDNTNISETEKDTSAGNSQTSELHTSMTTLQKNQELKKQNTELFDKHLQHRRNLLEIYDLKTPKFSRSASLVDIQKISQNLPSSSSLKRSLSAPTIYQFSGSSYLKNSTVKSESENSLLESYLSSHIKNKTLLIAKGSENFSDRTDTSLFKLKRSESLSCSEKTNFEIMEVVAPLPVATSTDVEKSGSNESKNCEIVTEKNISASHTVEISSNLSNSSYEHATLASVDKLGSNNSNLVVNEKVVKLVDESADLNLSDKSESETCIVKDTVPINADSAAENQSVEIKLYVRKLTEITETLEECLESINDSKEQDVSKLNLISSPEHESKISCNLNDTKMEIPNTQKNEIGENKSENLDAQKFTEVRVMPKECSESIDASKEQYLSKLNVISNSEHGSQISCNSDDAKMEIPNVQKTCHHEVGDKKSENLDAQKLIEVRATSKEYSESIDVSKEEYLSKLNLISSNEHANRNPCNLHDAKMKIQNVQKPFHQKIGDSKSVTAEIISVKRKLESKNRSSKKRRNTREKQTYFEVRSIKKAGEIFYSVEHIKSMLDIMKQFL